MTELIDRISAALVGLKMPRALEALGPTLRRLEQGEITAVEAIDALLSEDCALRETRRIDIALRTAKLLPVKTVESFDFAFQPSLDRERIAALGPARLHPETRNRPLPRTARNRKVPPRDRARRRRRQSRKERLQDDARRTRRQPRQSRATRTARRKNPLLRAGRSAHRR